MNAIYMRAVGRTDRGRVRPKNEDAFVIADLDSASVMDGDGASRRLAVGDRGVVLAVSDGVGGRRAGEVASSIVVETITRELATRPLDAPADRSLESAVKRAHETVVAASRRPGRARMGATLTAVYVRDRQAYVAEVGDSRAYLIRAGRITQLTKDQTYVQILLDAGAMDTRDLDASPLRNVILQCMGQPQDIDVAIGRLELRRRDCLVLCSDGLSSVVTDEEIKSVVLRSNRLERACDALVDLANERGGTDNVTVILAGVGGELPAPGFADDAETTFELLKSFDAKVGDVIR